MTSNPADGGRRYSSHAFTEQGVAMLSSVLTSRRAIAVMPLALVARAHRTLTNRLITGSASNRARNMRNELPLRVRRANAMRSEA